MSPNTSNSSLSNGAQLFLLLGLLLLTALAYLPGLTGGFAFDDYAAIIRNQAVMDAEITAESLAEVAWSGGVAGQLKRPLPMLSFAANAIYSGSSPLAYKITNLVIHLLNGVLLFFIFRILLSHKNGFFNRDFSSQQAFPIALFATAIWLVHPLNLTTVLYVVQRMTSIAAFFSLLSIYSYAYGRVRQLSGVNGRVYIFLFSPLFAVLAIFSKENAILLVPMIAIIELIFFRFGASAGNSKDIEIIRAYSIGGIAIVGVVLTLLFHLPEWLSTRYEYQPYSLSERLLTEARVLWFYLSLFFFPRLTEFALYHDDIRLSISLFEPITTLIAATTWPLLLALALWKRRYWPYFSFGVLWFLAGHALESTIIPLDIAHEHRNYLPSVGIALLVSFSTYRFLMSRIPRFYLHGIAIGLVCILVALTSLRAASWSDPVSLATIEAENHPSSFRSVYAAARVMFEYYKFRGDDKYYQLALEKLTAAAELDERNALPHIALIHLQYGRGQVPTAALTLEMNRRLKEELTHLPEASALGGYVQCHTTNESCVIPAKLVMDTYYAALANETLRPKVRAKLLTDFAAFSVNKFGDIQLALSMTEEALALSDNISVYHQLYIRLLILNGRFDEAQTKIAEFKNRRFWKDRIQVSEALVNELQSFLDSSASQKP